MSELEAEPSLIQPGPFWGAGNNGAVSTARASSFLNCPGVHGGTGWSLAWPERVAGVAGSIGVFVRVGDLYNVQRLVEVRRMLSPFPGGEGEDGADRCVGHVGHVRVPRVEASQGDDRS